MAAVAALRACLPAFLRRASARRQRSRLALSFVLPALALGVLSSAIDITTTAPAMAPTAAAVTPSRPPVRVRRTAEARHNERDPSSPRREEPLDSPQTDAGGPGNRIEDT